MEFNTTYNPRLGSIPVGSANTALVEQRNDSSFYSVDGKNEQRMEIVAEIFRRILTPLYGSQDKAIGQIRDSKDRKCYLLYNQNVPVGVLVYKTVLSNEFAEYGIRNSIEIKSLFVDHAAQNSGRGLGSLLVDKLKQKICKLKLEVAGTHVTVSETKQESLQFFRKKGFNIAHAWNGRYSEGVTEYLLYCPLKTQEANQAPQGLEMKFNAFKLSTNQSHKVLHVIENAHFDDIHSLKLLSDGTFISGSKDNSLRKWDKTGQLVKNIYDVEPVLQSSKNWVTSVQIINDEYWVSGERNGRIFLWTTAGEYIKEIKLKLPKQGHHSQPLNTQRVNCLAAGLNPNKPSMFVGLPTMFDEYNFIEGRTESCTSVHKNDWVYCIHPLSPTKVFVVIGGMIKEFNRTENRWSAGDVILPEADRISQRQASGKVVRQRQFISSIISLQSSPNHFGVSLFGGFVKTLDAESRTVVNTWREHTGRIWSLENIGLHTFASSGEDRTIKIWDIRAKQSIHTIGEHIGQVTALLRLDENILLAGTCPDQALTSKHGAEIRFYDHRTW